MKSSLCGAYGRDDTGDVVAFLASDAARWLGDTIRVDGGSKL
jgi:NAD(P)-dependent dehydrogenase (short-subunit alcohol dehydrogenase family)